MENALPVILASALVLTACGGGGGGGSGSGSESGGEVAGDPVVMSSQSSAPVVQQGVYRADQEVDERFELYRFDTSGSGTVKLSGVLPTEGDVENFTISPDGSRVAYRADQDTDNQIELYIASLEGDTIVRINPPMIAEGDVNDFRWSPDGTRIVYIADAEQDNVDEVYLADRDGGNHRKISEYVGGPPTIELFFARWSPDGRYVAQMVSRLSDGVTIGINTYDSQNPVANSTAINPTLVAGGAISSYAWSPDSSRIAYLADQETNDVFELYSATPDGAVSSKLNAMLATGGDVADNFAWSPDGSRIAYLADQETNNVVELYTATADGTANDKANQPLVTGGDVSSIFAWSPDGSRIAYLADQDTNNVVELYTATADGTANDKVNAPLVAGGNVFSGSFAWSPDGTRIAYRADQDTNNVAELYSANPDGTDNVKLNAPLVGGGSVIAPFAWSPDSSRVAYIADQDTNDVFELYSATPDGTANDKVNAPLVAGGNVFSGSLAWAADGSRIAYLADQDTDEVAEIFSATADGSVNDKVNAPLVAGGNGDIFSWAP